MSRSRSRAQGGGGRDQLKQVAAVTRDPKTASGRGGSLASFVFEHGAVRFGPRLAVRTGHKGNMSRSGG